MLKYKFGKIITRITIFNQKTSFKMQIKVALNLIQ